MKDELDHGTSWAVLLCSSLQTSKYMCMMVLNAALVTRSKPSVASILKSRWNRRCGYATHMKRTLASMKKVAPEQRSSPFILAIMSLVC
jgi:hypothetical protein